MRWSHDTQYFRKDGPHTRWEIVLRKVKERSVPAQLLMPEDTSPFLLLKMYQVILVWGSTWVSDACLHAGSYATNTVKVTSSQITRELFGRAEERKPNVSFPFTSTAGLQLSPVVSTAGCLEWGRGCQVMVNVQLQVAAYFIALRWWILLMTNNHLGFIQIAYICSSRSPLRFHPFPLFRFY